jgi:hypothetical protein
MSNILRTTSNGNLRDSASGTRKKSITSPGRDLTGEYDATHHLKTRLQSNTSLDPPVLPKKILPTHAPTPPLSARPEHNFSPRLERALSRTHVCPSPPVEEKSLGSVRNNPFLVQDRTTSGRARYQSASGDNMTATKNWKGQADAEELKTSLEGLSQVTTQIKVVGAAQAEAGSSHERNCSALLAARSRKPAKSATISSVSQTTSSVLKIV